jgi:hypothetical protein
MYAKIIPLVGVNQINLIVLKNVLEVSIARVNSLKIEMVAYLLYHSELILI